MNVWLRLKARVIWLFGTGLVVAGLLPVLYFIAVLCLQFSTGFELGSLRPAAATPWFTDAKAGSNIDSLPELLAALLMKTEVWLTVQNAVAWMASHMHVGLAVAVFGAIAMTVGALVATRQTALLRTEKRRRNDRQRRARKYGDDRLEPFIGDADALIGQASSGATGSAPPPAESTQGTAASSRPHDVSSVRCDGYGSHYSSRLRRPPGRRSPEPSRSSSTATH
jgi:hypothetical protein